MSRSADGSDLLDRISAGVKRAWWGFLLLGLLMVVVGLAALLVPVSATVGTVWLVAFLLIGAGVIQAVQSFSVPGWKGTLWQLLVGLLKAAFGVWLVLSPGIGAIALTIFFGIAFIVDGVAKAGLAVSVRPEDGWGWILAAGLVSLLLGVWVLVTLGTSYAVLPGIVIGVALLFEGLAYVVIALAARRLVRAAIR